MIVSHKHRFIFIKTRKTAGSTLEKLIYPYLGERDVITDTKDGGYEARNTSPGIAEHCGWQRIHSRHEYAWNNYYKFTIERNPYDKAVSAWFWHQKIKPDYPGVSTGKLKDYLLHFSAVPVDWPSYADKHTDELMVDDAFKYEELYKVYDMLKDKFGIDIPEEDWKGTRLKSGIRPKTDWHEYYDDETQFIASEIWKREIKHFGYKYE